MRTLSSGALAELAKQYGTEPIIILEIEWSPGSKTYYADKPIFGYTAKILDVSAIDMVLTAENLQTQQVTITLDDTDNEIKSILDNVDVHKKRAVVYMYYGGLTSSDRFEMFTGQISSPFTWLEGERQITFTILSLVETYEVGFSPEEGQLDFVSPSRVGENWPLAFGHVVHVPATKAQQVEEARLLDILGIVDPTLKHKLEWTKFLFNQEAFILQFWRLVLDGADALAPPIAQTLTALITAIINLNNLEVLFAQVQADLDQQKQKVQKNPWNLVARFGILIGSNNLNFTAQTTAIAKAAYEQMKEQVRLARYEYELKKKAANEQVRAYNRMRQLMSEIVDIERELCQQKRFVRDTVRVQDSLDIFEPDVNTEVIIKGLQFTVKFSVDPEEMEIVSQARSQFSNVAIAPWTPDDSPCSDIGQWDGLDMFRLADPNPPNLTGMYLLVEKAGTDDSDGVIVRHIIKVVKQIGQKVYFELVPWKTSGGGTPRAVSLDKIISTLTEVPWIPGPFGAPIPANLGNIDPNAWIRPEFQILQQVILSIGGPVTQEELRLLTELVFLLPSDQLTGSVNFETPGPRETFTIVGPDVVVIMEAAGTPLEHWFTNFEIPFEEVPESAAWHAEPGAAIRNANDSCEIYIANLLPSTIKAVHAYRTNEDGERFLAPVPSKYYIKNEAANLGTYTVTSLAFPRPLKWIPGENWEDDVYVTMNSSVGRRVTSVIQWLVETYIPGKTVNASNFSDIDTILGDKYPVDFALFDRIDALEEIRRIAWESRLAVLIYGDEFYLTYLSGEPDSDTDIDLNVIKTNQFAIEYTQTEDLMTEIIATHKSHYLPLSGRERDTRLIYRHNVSKYGLHRQEEFFHTFAYRELVEKSATFWLIRRSNTWKKITLQVSHTKTALEVLDTVTLKAYENVSNNEIKTIVERATYDTNNNLINLTLHTGIRSGEMDQYIHFWPAFNNSDPAFPTASDFPGNVGPGAGVVGRIDC